MVKIVTIEREYGTGASAVARELASRLGWNLWDGAISQEIARRLKCEVSKIQEREERLDPTYYRLMKIFMRGSYEDSFQGKDVELLDAESLFRLFEKVISDAAGKGNCVIVGRAAPWFLRERDDAVHVFLYGSTQDKIERVMSQGKTRKDAELLVEQVDRERAAFVKKYYGKQWPSRELYHLMINTKVGIEPVVQLIQTQMALMQHRAATAS